MRTSAAGIAALQRRERCRLRAYQGADDPSDVWTIGWGHSSRIDSSVREGVVWTQAQCDAALAADLQVFERGVEGCAMVPLEQHEFDAMVSFAYNEGVGALRTSTFLRLVNCGQKRSGAQHLCLFCKSNGSYSDGLNVRRADEMLQFMGV